MAFQMAFCLCRRIGRRNSQSSHVAGLRLCWRLSNESHSCRTAHINSYPCESSTIFTQCYVHVHEHAYLVYVSVRESVFVLKPGGHEVIGR